MNALVMLLFRIARGEKFERGTREDTARWLSLLFLLPVLGALPLALQKVFGSFLEIAFDSLWTLIPATVVLGLLGLAAIGGVARLFRKRPMLLIPLAAVSWSLAAWKILTL